MEPQRGGEQHLAWGAPSAAAAACLCPAAVASSAAGNVFPRQALEQEMLRRAELQLQGGGGVDRRRERKMKNRESAARSRLRRLAYVNELEKEVSLLRAEKEELSKLCQEVGYRCVAVFLSGRGRGSFALQMSPVACGCGVRVQLKEAADEAPAPAKRAAPRRLLQRTSSAPF